MMTMFLLVTVSL